MVFNATFNDISYISLRSVLLMEETQVKPNKKWTENVPTLLMHAIIKLKDAS